jgi:hypothetical protein
MDPVCRRCGFPVESDGQGGQRHVSGADALVCGLLFGGGSMLDALMNEED